VIDLTCVRDDSRTRVGIGVSADDTIVSDNQVYVRGEVDPLVKGMVLTEPARNLLVHDNLIRGCGVGLQGGKRTGRIAEVIDSRTFKSSGPLPWPRRRTHEYRGCRIAWSSGNIRRRDGERTMTSETAVRSRRTPNDGDHRRLASSR